jgi:acetyl esterase/lipase
MALANQDVIVGIKTAHWAAPDWHAVDRAVKAAEISKLPVMVDFGIIHIERPHRDLFLDKLRPGDIYTHMYRPFDPVLDADGKLRPYYRTARERGILFDVGHGSGSLLFKWAVPAMRQGFVPDTISTDLHTSSANGGMKNMLATMSKFLNMNMPLADVIRASTWAPAQAIRRPALGHLTVGAEADVAVLRLDQGQYGFLDVGGSKIGGTQLLQCELTLRAGRVAWDQNGIAADPWEKQSAQTFEYKPGLTLTMVGRRGAAPKPAVLWIHGGGWTGGRPEMFLPAAEYSAAQGAIAFTVQYRLGSVAPAVEDVEAALVWIRKHAAELGVDPQRVIAAGDSAGGHLALALGTVTRERANAIVAYNPIPDLTGKWAAPAGSPAEARRLSPLFHIDAKTPPALLLHGRKDTVVPFTESERFARAHAKAKVVLYPDSQHAFVVPGYTATPAEIDRALRDSFSWLREAGLLPLQP